MSIIGPSTDIQGRRVAALHLIAALCDNERRPAPCDLSLREYEFDDDGELVCYALTLGFDHPDHIETWCNGEVTEGFQFTPVERRLTADGRWETTERRMIASVLGGPIWHGWHQVYLRCTRPVPHLQVAGEIL